jgi:hypothetical protein
MTLNLQQVINPEWVVCGITVFIFGVWLYEIFIGGVQW